MDEHWEVNGGETVPQRRQHPSLGRVCEAIVNRGTATIGEAPESVRGLTRVQYPSRVNERGYGG